MNIPYVEDTGLEDGKKLLEPCDVTGWEIGYKRARRGVNGVDVVGVES